MFTGLIEEVGHVASIEKRPDAIRLSIQADRVLEDAAIGDSIAVNGACVTVTGRLEDAFSADIMPETIRATTLHSLQAGDSVNLERAVKAGGRLGGHFVTGHIDGTGKIVRIVPKGNAYYLDIQASPDILAGLVQKGSVAVDGTSLTVFHAGPQFFTLSLIPHTYAHTVLGSKKVGDSVNIEGDILQKYVQNQLTAGKSDDSGSLTYDMLKENGFNTSLNK
ncbi:riboflavin synthase [Sporolactobacillus sp. CQH2019]|uniref:riboflavin synthase n=1 Tax=Sporolactobacillus sp. CQH2019 TaxID=3023512 RepID=UPI0023682370|nr:riboflavin synthase [Sporolactobacillus sp. CQH2019]MDD9149561.1 riboflavin synthase [Sporolactobacillus sp. CQH2019]